MSMGRARFLVAVVAICGLLAACGGSGSSTSATTSATTTASTPTPSTGEMTSGSAPTAPATTNSSGPTSTGLTPVDPSSYADTDGAKYAFSVSGGGHCWLFTGQFDGTGFLAATPAVECYVPELTTQTASDPLTGVSGAAQTVRIDGFGVYLSPSIFPTGGQPPEVTPGSSITVSNMTCEIPAENAVRCAAQTGEFSFADGAVQILRSEPSPYKAAGAGKVCPEVDAPGGPAPVIILAGKLSCDTAASVIEKYFAMPVDPMGGNTNPQEFDGFYCAAPTAARAEELGIGLDCEADGIRVILPYP